MSLKLYHFKNKYLSPHVRHDKLILAKNKKIATVYLGQILEIEDYLKSKVKEVEYTLDIEATIKNSKIYMDASVAVTVTEAECKLQLHERVSHEDVPIYISEDLGTQSELLKLFNQRFKSATLYHEEE